MTTTLQEDVANKLQQIANESSKKYREKLNASYHILDFSFSALKHSEPQLTETDYQQLLAEVRKNYREMYSLKDAVSVLKDPSSKYGFAALVEDSKYGTYILGKNYNTVQSKLASILKNIEHASSFTSIDETGKTITNIGHTPNFYLDSAVSPLGMKLRKILETIPMGPAQFEVIDFINELHDTHILETTYEFQRENFDISGFNKILGSGVVYVTLQTFSRNNAIAAIETEINRALIAYLGSEEFKEKLPEFIGSKSIKKEIVEGITATILGEKYISKHVKSPTKKKTTKLNLGKTTTIPVTSVRLPSLKNRFTGQFMSLINLQFLLNTHLQDMVSAMMGDGDRRDILNYRTGRFAASVKVKNVTRSREGMVTVFYNYMKNPYATFSDGGHQQYPKTRDPKLLISKSIREIAGPLVSNRLRSVVV